MKNIPFQQELKVSLPVNSASKATLQLSPTGDLQLVEGEEKLITQILRAIVNDNVISYGIINSMENTHRTVSTMLVSALRVLRNTQLDEVGKSDTSCSGFHVWRRAAESTDQFVRVSTNLVSWKFTDSKLTNGTLYEYAITKSYENVYNSKFLDRFTVTPYRNVALRDDVLIGKYAIAFPGDQEAVFYVNYNRRFKASEILDGIERIETSVDSTDPRRVLAQVLIKNYLGNLVSIASGKAP